MSSHLVLVVEDDADIRVGLRDLLEFEGFRVAQAGNGLEALILLETIAPPSLILLDLVMPVMDGVEFLERARQTPQIAQVPVVILSASSTVRPPPGTPMLRKPVAVDRLLDTISCYAH